MQAANLALRFFLEISALGGFGTLAWRSTEGLWRYLSVIVVLCVLMALWGVFAVPHDPSRSGTAPFPVSGLIRLLLELAILFGGAFAYHQSGYNMTAIGLAVLIIVHYGLSGQRIAWLLQQ